MRMTRLFVQIPLAPGGIVELPADTAAHMVRVLRARSGDALILFNGDGSEYQGCIETIRGTRVNVALTQGRAMSRESPLQVVLVQAIPRGDRMDFVIQKATELGVARIVPVLSARSVVRLNERQYQSKLEHWRGVAVSACEQCGRNRIPLIDPPLELLDHLGAPGETSQRWVLDPESQAAAPMSATLTAAEVTIGPEGGFSPEELDAMRIAGLQGIRLGPRVLRTETAALVALTFLQTRFGDMNPTPA